MLKENEKSFNNNTDYLLEKMNIGNKKYINKRKQQLSKRAYLINYSDNFNKKEYINSNKDLKSKNIFLNSDIKNLTTSKNLNKVLNKSNNNSSYCDLNLSSNYKNKSINYPQNKINLKSHFNSFNLINKNINFKNYKEINKNTRYDSFIDYQKINLIKPDFFNTNFLKDRTIESKLNSLYSHKIDKNTNLIKINKNINRTFYKGKNKKYTILNPFKYSSNYRENNILKQILKHPNLKLLYETNEIRAKNMVQSHSKSLKKNLSLKKYQQNLVKNTLMPFDRRDRRMLLQSFQKINKDVVQNRKLDLFEYLKEIQKKEKELVMNHNELEEIYSKNIEKIGFPVTGKRKIHIEKMKFIDVFQKK